MAERRAKDYVSLALVGAVLISAVLFVRSHAEPLKAFIDHNPVLGVFLYILLNILDAVVLPGATLPLIPVAAHAWGRVMAAVVTTAGWTAGSLVAFLIARQWGSPIVRKLTSMSRVRQLKKYIPENLFWSVVAMRLVMPMDVLSYVLGLFTDMSWPTYILATAMGVTPAAFVLVYVGKLSRAYDLITFGVAAVLVVAFIVTTKRGRKNR
jgi:uncharacterized membrane protein YdjX (TVP38/TMEM64 family)